MIPAWIIQNLLYREMRRKNPALWTELGAPDAWNTGLFSKFRKFHFIWSSEHSRFDDRRIRAKVIALRIFEALGFLLFGLLVVSTISGYE
jgi:hypothetical protein